MDLIHRSCCGLDVRKAVVVACVIVQEGRKEKQQEVRRFPAAASGLSDMAQWIQSMKCTCVAMESTGPYWEPVYEALESVASEVIVANARHFKNVPGRKAEVCDAEWICDLARHGLLSSEASCRPKRFDKPGK